MRGKIQSGIISKDWEQDWDAATLTKKTILLCCERGNDPFTFQNNITKFRLKL